MKRKVCLETSVISYLTARPSKTIVGVAHQQITASWWEGRGDYELFVSDVPAKAAQDALHIAVATIHGMDYLLTWNCRHIANLAIQRKIAHYLESIGLLLPVMCTPEELLGENDDDIIG